MSKKTLRKAYQKELAMALRTKRVPKDRNKEDDFGYAEQPANKQWGYNG